MNDSPTSSQFSMNTGNAGHQDKTQEGVVGRRIIAYLIDAFLLSLAVPVGMTLSFLSLGLLAPIVGIALFAIPFLYHSLLIATPRGATVGQRVMGLRVVSFGSGQQVEFLQALLQVVLFYASLGFSGGLLLLWCLFDDRGRCLHEIFSGTVTLRDQG